MAMSNADKAQHGRYAEDALISILDFCVGNGYLKRFEKNLRIGKSGFKNNEQFYALAAIEFCDGTKWVLYSTTSMRTDRVKEQQWDVSNLKDIDKKITAGYLVYPDIKNEKEKSRFVCQNNKYSEGMEYSAIDAIVSQDKIFDMIEEHAMEIAEISPGRKKDLQGKIFERRVANILNYELNLKKWKDIDSGVIEGLHYDLFEKIVCCLGLNKKNIESIDATADNKIIGHLPSGGLPKTDILITVTQKDKSVQKYTISCKRSSSKKVSVHEYSADKFAEILDPENCRLRQLLNEFQEAGTLGKFGKANCNALTSELRPYINRLSLWVLGGINGDGDPNTQWANYMLTYKNEDGSACIYSIEDYCKMIIKDSTGNFGTPFSWTFASKSRGEKIQLKCAVL